MNYFVKDGNKLKCLLCNHYCKIDTNKSGVCGVNINTGEKIECIVYGYPKALNIDPVEKKPLYHFLPKTKTLSLGTVACNFKCSFCQNWSLSQTKDFKEENYFSAESIVNLALKNSCNSISYTYNEPTIFYPYARDICKIAKNKGLKNIFVSNGFESKEVISDMIGLVDAINVDLKCFDEKYYKKLGGSLDKVLENIETFYKNGIWIEVTTLVVPSKNDSFKELEKIASFLASISKNIPWHLSAFHPDYKETALPNTSVTTLERAKKIGEKKGLNYVYIGNLGLENITYCKKCKKNLISRSFFQTETINLNENRCDNCDEILEGVF